MSSKTFLHRAPAGQERNFSDLKSAPRSSLSRDSQESRALQEAYKDCLQPGAYSEYTDENFWLWFEPSYKHPYHYVSWFVSTGKNDCKPPKMD
jgi:hypothetical protein